MNLFSEKFTNTVKAQGNAALKVHKSSQKFTHFVPAAGFGATAGASVMPAKRKRQEVDGADMVVKASRGKKKVKIEQDEPGCSEQQCDLPPTPAAESRRMLNMLSYLAKKGNPAPLLEYQSKQTQQGKRAFYQSFMLDPSCSWCLVRERTSEIHSQASTNLKGWLNIWEIQNIEKIPDLEVIKKLVETLPSRLHENPVLAAEGVRLYKYEKRLPEQESHTMEQCQEVTAEAEVEAKDYQDVLSSMVDKMPTAKVKPKLRRQISLEDKVKTDEEKQKQAACIQYKKLAKAMESEVSQASALIATAEVALEKDKSLTHLLDLVGQVKNTIVPFRKVMDSLQQAYHRFEKDDLTPEVLQSFDNKLSVAKSHFEAFKGGRKQDLKKLIWKSQAVVPVGGLPGG